MMAVLGVECEFENIIFTPPPPSTCHHIPQRDVHGRGCGYRICPKQEENQKGEATRFCQLIEIGTWRRRGLLCQCEEGSLFGESS